MSDPPKMTREEAEAAVLGFEGRVRSTLCHFSPEAFAVEVAKRFRLGQVDVEAMCQHPPHMLIHALEANCAYYQPWKIEDLTDNRFATAINLWHDFYDPVLMGTLKNGTHLFEFVQYLHRTQMEVQGGLSHLRFGRALRVFGDPEVIPVASSIFFDKYGLSPRDWLKLLFIFYARTGDARKKRLPPPGIRRAELLSVPELGIPVERLDAFLAEASRSWDEIGAMYRAIRRAGETDRRAGPLTWSQRRPALARYPIMRMAMGYLVPAPPLLLRSSEDGLFERFDALDSEPVRADLGKQFERYVADMIRAHLPTHRLVGGSALKQEGVQSCDFALELPDGLLLIECKAVMLDRELVTERAVLGSAAIQRLIAGYVQIVRTAHRIRNGGYPEALLPRDKPVVGLVATLGNVPGADNGAVLDAMRQRFEKEGITEQEQASLLHRPQPFDAEALEYLVLLLQRGTAQVSGLFGEKLAANPWHTGAWPIYLNKMMQPLKPFGLEFWSERVKAFIAEMGHPDVAADD